MSSTKLPPITIQETKSYLDDLLDKYEWFYCSEIEKDGTIRAYVERMDKDVVELVPQSLYGFEVHLAFAAYIKCMDNIGIINIDLGPRMEIDIN